LDSLYNLILDVLGSNLDRDISYPNWRFSRFSSEDGTSNTPWTLSSKSSQILYSPVFLPFNVIYSRHRVRVKINHTECKQHQCWQINFVFGHRVYLYVPTDSKNKCRRFP
jgi:hypothetical protein